MSTTQIVFSIILFLVSIGSFTISYRQFKEKGFLFNNSYIFASKDERNRMDKKPHYRQSAIVFLGVGIMFCMISLNVILSWGWLILIAVGISILLIIYAIISSINIERKHKRR